MIYAILILAGLVAAFVAGAYIYKRKGAKMVASAKAEYEYFKKEAEDLKGKIPKI